MSSQGALRLEDSWPLLPALSLSDEMRIKERRGTGKEDGNQDGGC